MTPVLLTYLPRFLHPTLLHSILPKMAPRPGVSIVAACSDRHPMLARAIVTWMQVSLVRQIVLVDWSSSPQLVDTVDAIIEMHAPLFVNVTPPAVNIVRVVGEPTWVLSRAYNLAVQHAAYQTIFKVDCDYLLHPEIVLSHVAPNYPPSFFAGSLDTARSLNEVYLSGVLIAPRELFLSVGGYDERIQTYGFEDEELYARLYATGATRKNISYDMIDHILHHDSSRITNGMPFPRVQMQVNRMLLKKIGVTWNVTDRHSAYDRVDGNRDLLKASYVVPDLRTLVEPDQLAKIKRVAIGARLHDDFGIPWAILSSLTPVMTERLLQRVASQREGVGGGVEGDRHANAHLMIIHVQNGIGNRLRTLGSGLAFAEATERVPIVIWEKDVQFGAVFDDVFNMSYVTYAVIDHLDAQWPLINYASNDSTWNNFVFHNYMLEEEVGSEIENVYDKNIYFKSSAIMNSEHTSWDSENENIRKLVVTDEVEGLARSAFDRLTSLHIGGVHIRNRSLDVDIPGMKPEDNRQFYYENDMSLIDKWRAYTKLSNFVPAMKLLLQNRTVTHFFVASDTIAVCKKLQNLFDPNLITFIDRQCDDRGAKCVKYAMADLIVLSRTKPLLGSTWSSFTEAAMRLGGPKALLAGLFLAALSGPWFCNLALVSAC